ncbi:MAG TPA: Mur ligase domain-containing protein [Sphaerochaetaceae bacterium]|nr:Mur ligase domain-containing protein [Sphaerochaetaceae bacterium]
MGLQEEIRQKNFFLVGIQGTGMASLSVLLSRLGAHVTGSDAPEIFSTSAVLEQAGIPWTTGFHAASLPSDTSVVIHSAAYDRESNPQLRRALELGLPLYSYPEWLAWMSRNMQSYAVAGTHGKTTACGCAEWVLRNTELPFCALYGSHIQGLHPGSLCTGTRWALFEACEYRDHFLTYELEGVLITTVEHDHPDWFATEESVFESFRSLVSRLPERAPVVCGTDSALARRLIDYIRKHRSDLTLITYGEHPTSLVRLVDYESGSLESTYSLSTLSGSFHSTLGSIPLVLDTIGAALLGSCMVLGALGELSASIVSSAVFGALMREAEQFPGTAKRLEITIIDDDVVYVDDYAHHPTEIQTALTALRTRFPDRSILTLFHPHTVSRTEAFFEGFVASLSLSDSLIVRPVFTSARSDGDQAASYELARRLAHDAHGVFVQDEHEAIEAACALLHRGDLCVTMGAGNTSGLAKRIAEGRRRSNQC